MRCTTPPPFHSRSAPPFNGALVFVGANALVAVFSYLVIVGEIKRVHLTRAPA